ncbi:type I-F CRISPR-associated protein Csy2 [Erwinia sorbitola]|uniref:Type I-F CRISPR-associated protein Csy2 n=1 Tax=Erwinia sorbitola TaxID=2681984 RepID=A0A6I6EG78_9GAMM|nr:type I-F CRISPR-associated protein Csy2 [Erwinia sorbitola]QGU88877.1 type I-F CRISPR-associated protein Csy2 [Erwinia sorbitola]
MSSLIILRNMRIENANAVAGLTWGFPAITHFLGFTHALSRQLQPSHGLSLDGCGVICHQQQVHAYSSDRGRDYYFSLTRNPLTREAKVRPFNEEGRMHMTVSLVMECNGMMAGGEQGIAALKAHLAMICPRLRLAGGTIIDPGQIEVRGWPQDEREMRRVLRRLLPGFALLDRSSLLSEHFSRMKQSQPEAEMLDAWLDFAALKIQSPQTSETEEKETAGWVYQPKPAGGFLVPLMIGYQAISPLYPAGKVLNSRDNETPFCFTEAVYGVGEWRGLHRINDLDELLWRYHYQDEQYLCRCKKAAGEQFYDVSDEEIDYS